MAVLGFSVVQACRFTENDVLCEWMAGAKDAHLHTWFQRRGQKPTFAPVMINLKDDGCKKAGFAHVNPMSYAKGVVLLTSFGAFRGALPAYVALHLICVTRREGNTFG